MKNLVFIFALLVSTGVFSKELEMNILIADSVIADPSLDSNSMAYFNFPNATDLSSKIIKYSIDGVQGEYSLGKRKKALGIELASGWHNLQFYFSSNYHEVYTSIDLEAGNRSYFSVHFMIAEIMIMSEKPVIYLYPEEEKDIHVEVEPTGEFTFTYPEYGNGWDVTATPEGQLKVNEEIYNYLFWEASEYISPNDVNTNEGFVVAGESITDFLEEKLTYAGLNGSERADFITFWAPRMTAHSDVFVQFHFNKQCDRFAELTITPKPDNIYRIYIVWQPVDQLRIAPEPQEIQVMDRSGFSVLEWGGQELPSTVKTNTL
jgi:hypothetical protein